jgi:hypothetical protein
LSDIRRESLKVMIKKRIIKKNLNA